MLLPPFQRGGAAIEAKSNVFDYERLSKIIIDANPDFFRRLLFVRS